MTVVVSSISRCSGTEHITVSGTVNGQARTIQFTNSDFAFEDISLEDRIIGRFVSAVKEANANTWTKIQNALVGKTFKV